MELVQVISEMAFLQGTFIEELFEALQSGKAVEDDGMDPVGPGEEIVGEMNELEKALSFLCTEYGKTERKIVDRFRKGGCTSKQEAELKAELDKCRSRFQVANALMWENIKTRLSKHDKPGSTAWGIRTGCKIVLLFGKEEHVLFPIGVIIGLR